ncbi:MBL fold metallo-hydrolase [Dethiosulfatarculus sandiegensis]|uniref:Lactamase n=1 Tax=Dethiosulfatarculus sandiegensis TaxID=1429043 RepID=A0A0D2JBQ0_9BACT|nr:MBL fold metallo-hydrolase [Dethiosulfatarculus sandiegensis]KIX15559.1 lactamase [Dethiosulfatarculus sandiegensis]
MKIIQMLVGQMAVYAYLIGCEKTGKAVVIDPAGNEEQITAKAKDEGLTIVKILNTHGHADHTCGNALMKKLTNAPILVHEADAPNLQSAHNAEFTRMLGAEVTPEADETFKHNDFIEVGEEVKLKVIHTPGHTPGCVCFFTPGHVFTGDTLFVGAVGRTDLPGGSFDQMFKSIQENILTLPDETVVWPGHNYGPYPKSTVAAERQTNPFLR